MIIDGLKEEKKSAAMFCKKCGGKLLALSEEEKTMTEEKMKIKKTTYKCAKCGDLTKKKSYKKLED